jgi:tripartite-type tricarboxylate transporter receptor subunit TctC
MSLSKLLTLSLVCFSFSALAEKPISIVVGFSAGGSADTAARVIAKTLGEQLNTTVIVENKPGAGGVIAHKYVADSKPDGRTLLLSSVGPLTAKHFEGLSPVITAVQFPQLFVVSSELGVRTLSEFLALSKDKRLTFASTGINSVGHVQGDTLSARAGVPMLHVPYKGGPLAVVDVSAARVSGMFTGYTNVEPYLKTGKLIALAASSAQRSTLMPDVPTVAEQGFPGFDMPNAYIFVAPGETPKHVVATLNQQLSIALKDKDTVANLAKYGFAATPMSLDATSKFISTNVATYSIK